MSVRVHILSGLDAKAPAAIRIDVKGRTLLLDAGGPLQADEPCDWYLDQSPDAILITHDHVDHIGAVRWLPETIPLYCTPTVAQRLPAGRRWHPLPRQGTITIEGINITCGLAGHSLDGIWLHLDIAGGIFYSGDFSFESLLYPFDRPPRAALALLDASYGLYSVDQSHCRDALQAKLNRASLLPVPPSGRALELALWCQTLELPWTFDPACQKFHAALQGLPANLLKPGIQQQLAQLTPRPWDTPENPDLALIRLAADAEGVAGEAGRLISDPDYTGQVIYTGYTPPKARADITSGRAEWCRWNVHPRLPCIQSLADTLQAEQVIPLFCPIDAAGWQAALGKRLRLDHVIHL
ncbi:MBL fold metallo-hydrolase [Nitrincola iocasae]|uniref:MBL fold metallo-hydrolase n=1 Tax=Nitrincola iocasae TaxID=2614693 RepID=A0A5J6LD59_9GAMM|nr:MBL fold metallo-hydrolase [Nitrincola iocasae]QEW06460.1 MBL fold metallo-hydrolase [Nitrincola iocasae]